MSRFLLAVAVSVALLRPAATTCQAEEQYFDSNGVKIHYLVEGEGEPVVLIHGFTASIPVQWALPGILGRLNKQYRVIALDNRGHGQSDKPHDPKQYGAEMTGDVLRLMDHLKVSKAHLVGYSMGGFMTGYLLAQHPDRVLSATLGGAGWWKADDERMQFNNVLADSLEAGKGMGPLIELLAPVGAPKPTEADVQMLNAMLTMTNDTKALAACARSMPGMAVDEAKLKANKIPTLCLIGQLDPLKVGVDEMAQRMPDLKVSVLDGADHMSAYSQPKFVEDLQAFLAANSKAKKAAPAAAP